MTERANTEPGVARSQVSGERRSTDERQADLGSRSPYVPGSVFACDDPDRAKTEGGGMVAGENPARGFTVCPHETPLPSVFACESPEQEWIRDQERAAGHADHLVKAAKENR